jgi:uncharacterized protein YciI
VPFFITTYAYTGDTDARLEARPVHRAFLAGLGDTLVASGPTDDGGAVLVLDTNSAAEAEALLDDDPYRVGGFIGSRQVVGWDVVLGRWATKA